MNETQTDNMPAEHRQRIERLACWHGAVEIQLLSGGITNANYLVVDRGDKFVVRLGGDIPVHQIMRFNELATSRAAHAAGLSPEVVHAEPGALVIRFIEGRVFDDADVRDPANLQRVVELVRRFHTEVPRHFRGPALAFWVFQVLRDYGRTLEAGNSRHLNALPRLATIARALEDAVGPVDIVFGHNDLLAANLIDDGKRLWLIDFDYAGFNSPLFDLANLAANNLLSPEQERGNLEAYFEEDVSERRWRSYAAMKCASLLRETMWSMVSEIHSTLDFDYGGYTAENLSRFELTYRELNAELAFQ